MTPGMLCPACKVDLVMSERQNVEIDYCPKCRGVWLDRGELDKIIERAVTQDAPPPPQPAAQHSAPPPPPPPPREYYREEHGGYDKHRKYGHRRKSWLEEIFD
jgi:Zn-finger nucleic acid-binding protein